MTKIKVATIEKIIITLIVIILITSTLCIIVNDKNISSKERNEMLNEFCQLEGYKEATDSKMRRNDAIDNVIMVECDGKHIINGHVTTRCSGENKWRECVGYEEIIYEVEVEKINVSEEYR